MMADANKAVLSNADQYIGALPGILQSAQQLMQQVAPPSPPPMDPSQAALKKAEMDNATKQQQLQQDQQQFQEKQQSEQQQQASQDQAKQASDQLHAETQKETAGINAQTKVQTTQMDNTTGETIAAAEIAAGKHTNVRNGEGIGSHGMG